MKGSFPGNQIYKYKHIQVPDKLWLTFSFITKTFYIDNFSGLPYDPTVFFCLLLIPKYAWKVSILLSADLHNLAAYSTCAGLLLGNLFGEAVFLEIKCIHINTYRCLIDCDYLFSQSRLFTLASFQASGTIQQYFSVILMTRYAWKNFAFFCLQTFIILLAKEFP